MTLENIVKNHHYLHLKQTSKNFAFQIIYVRWSVLVLWCLWPVIMPCVPALFSQPLCSSTVTLLLFLCTLENFRLRFWISPISAEIIFERETFWKKIFFFFFNQPDVFIWLRCSCQAPKTSSYIYQKIMIELHWTMEMPRDMKWGKTEDFRNLSLVGKTYRHKNTHRQASTSPKT